MEPHVLKPLIVLLGLVLAGIPAFGGTGAGESAGAGGGAGAGAAPATGFWAALNGETEDQAADTIVRSLSDDERLAQLFMLGYVGTDPSPEILQWIAGQHVGGVKIFTRNVDTLPDLARGISAMQGLSRKSGNRIPLFIATDQEGGWVRHIKRETSVSPGNLAIGASRVPRDAYLTGYYLGMELAALGVNMNFAPTADVYANPEASVIGPRSFGSDPAETGLLSAAYARGMAAAGILCTAKHFPGHGSADQDSHGHLPVITASMETLRARDLVPYRILSREGVPAVMSAHLAFPTILGDRTPSSLSPYFMRTVLRGELGFRGIVITDDMEMEGVLNSGIDTPTACRRAIEAGNDMILISHTPAAQELTWSSLRNAMRTSAAFKAAVTDSARRIVRTKLRFFRARGNGGTGAAGQPASNGPVSAAGRIPAPGAAEFFFDSACRSVSLLRSRRVPYRPAARERILLCGQFTEFLAEGKLRYPGADTLLFPFMPFYSSRPQDRVLVPSRAAGYDTVIFCLANFNSLEVLQRMRGLARRIIVISALSPVYLTETPWVETSIAVYGSGSDSFRAGFAALAGDFTPTATLPVHFPDQPGARAAEAPTEGNPVLAAGQGARHRTGR